MTLRRRTRHGASLLVVIALVALATGCGTHLSQEQLAAANGAFTSTASGGTGGAGTTARSSTAGAGATGTTGESATDQATTGNAVDPGAVGGSGATDGSGPAADAGVAGCPSGGGQKSEIVLGTFGTEGGVIGANVATAPVGIRAWQADVNARGGLCGHPVRVVFGGNDGGDPAQSQAITRKLVEEDHVVAFLAPYSPTGIAAVYPYLEQVRVPVIADAPPGPSADSRPLVFTPATSLEGIGYGLVAAFASQVPQRKIGILSLVEVAGAAESVNNAKAAAPLFGAQVVYEAKVSLAQPDFTSEMTAAKNAGADVILAAVDFTTMTKIIKSAQRQNYSPVFAGSYAFDNDAVKVSSDVFEGVIAYAVTANYESAPLADYRQAVATYVPRGQLGMLGPVAWAGGKLLERIAPQLPDDPTSADIINALYTVHDETLGGIVPSFSFVQGGGSPYHSLCVQPVRFVGGKWTSPLGDSFFQCRQ